ncbi:hypothetical protein DL771_000551 [Monosporascus sp. 5C6A]|nr:hypothetical protein DL771_000551 [Monosporascus sp. 5C6A]
MRLLRTRPVVMESSLELEEFFDNEIPRYAILSHTWIKGEEVTFQDIQKSRYERKKGFAKILGCCARALGDGYDWVWVDTCCIDKSSSAELSEGKSRAWGKIATRNDLRDVIDEATGINARYLGAEELTDVGWGVPGNQAALNAWAAEKFSWASRRTTSRKEDMAYCLMGLFRINMPLLYGEGERAFIRLQEELIKQEHDHTILAWGMSLSAKPAGNRALASSPAEFAGWDRRIAPTRRIPVGHYLTAQLKVWLIPRPLWYH